MAGGLTRAVRRAVGLPVKEKRRALGRLEARGVRATGGAAMRPDGFPVIDGPHYLDVLGALHERLKPGWYLEIGAFKGHSLSRARGDVIAVDPEFRFAHPVLGTGRRGHFFQMTSRDFFAEGFLERNGIAPDLAFLDGLHLYEALLDDFVAAEARMRPGGAILLHDCAPTSHAMAARTWDEKATAAWTGDVWKTLAILLEHRPDLRIDVLDAWPTGLAVVRGLDPASRVLAERLPAIRARWEGLDLATHGVARYFDAFEIRASEAFVATLGA